MKIAISYDLMTREFIHDKEKVMLDWNEHKVVSFNNCDSVSDTFKRSCKITENH